VMSRSRMVIFNLLVICYLVSDGFSAPIAPISPFFP
jgi:hypothetical protein